MKKFVSENDRKKLQNRIPELRFILGLSQDDLGAILGKSRVTINSIEKGDKVISSEFYFAFKYICCFFHRFVDDHSNLCFDVWRNRLAERAIGVSENEFNMFKENVSRILKQYSKKLTIKYISQTFIETIMVNPKLYDDLFTTNISFGVSEKIN